MSHVGSAGIRGGGAEELGPQLEALRETVSAQVAAASLTSCQFALARDGHVLLHETVGDVPTGSRFLLMSASKVLLASVVWQLIGQRLLDPGQPVTRWWPEFGQNGKPDVTLEHVLSHSAGLANATLSDEAILDRERRVAEMEAWQLEWPAGSSYEYHGLSAHWIIAELIERVTGEGHVDALRRRILDPLGLDRLELGVPVGRQGDVQPVSHVGSSPTLPEIEAFLGVPLSRMPSTPAAPASADIVTRLTEPEIMRAGIPGAGGVSDAASLAMFYQHLLHDPEGLWDSEVLTDATRRPRNTHADWTGRRAFRSLGLEVAGDDEGRVSRIGAGATSAETFGHSGAGGQVAWADPVSGLSFVFLTATIDRDFVRQYKRDAAVTRAAAACAT